MSDFSLGIPNHQNWPEKSLADISKLLRRGTAPSYVAASSVQVIGQRCVQESGFQADKARPHDPKRIRGSLVAEEGDVLVNSTGSGTIGRSCVFRADGPFVVDSHITVIRPREGIDPEWIDLVLRSPWGQRRLESHCFAGSTNQIELSRRQLALTTIPVPPWGVQSRIVTLLGSLSAAERGIETSIAKLRVMRSAVIDSLLDSFDWSNLLPDALEGSIRNGISPVESASWTGVQMLGLGCLTPEGFRPDQLKHAPPSISPKHSAALVDGDLLMSRANTRELVGLVGVYRDVGTPCIYPDLMMRLRPSKKSSAPFLAATLMANRARREIRSMAQGTSESMVKISAGAAKRIRIPLPVLEEQERVLAASRIATERIESEIAEMVKLRELKQGLVDDLLSGRVTVAAAGG